VIVYVETNFLLELAYLQEGAESCAEILQLAQANSIALVLPAFCVAEARGTSRRRESKRLEFHQAFKVHLREIARSAPYRALNDHFDEISEALLSGGEDVRQRLEAPVSVAADVGEVISMTARVINLAYAIEIIYSLKPDDALVLASVQSHAEQHGGPKCFVTQDTDFSNSVVVRDLTAMGCKVIVNFKDALAYVKNALRKNPEL
jgi:predicted nucleic acid-binding protein